MSADGYSTAIGPAPKVVGVGPLPEGAVAIVTLSQEQLGWMCDRLATAAWLIEEDRLVLGRASDDGLTATAVFDLHNEQHRRAITDVLERGTLCIRAAESVRDGWIEGRGLAIDVRPADRWMLELALEQTAP